MLHLLINPVSRYTLFFQLPKPFKFDAKPQNTNSALQITLLHPFKSGKLSHQGKENSGTAPSTIQTEASKKVTRIIDPYFIIYMCCTFISITITDRSSRRKEQTLTSNQMTSARTKPGSTYVQADDELGTAPHNTEVNRLQSKLTDLLSPRLLL